MICNLVNGMVKESGSFRRGCYRGKLIAKQKPRELEVPVTSKAEGIEQCENHDTLLKDNKGYLDHPDSHAPNFPTSHSQGRKKKSGFTDTKQS